MVERVSSFLVNNLHSVSDKMLDIIFHSRSISVNLDSNSYANPMASHGYFL